MTALHRDVYAQKQKTILHVYKIFTQSELIQLKG